MVLVVLAHPADEAAAALVRRWKDHDARLLTSTDLTRSGWQAPFPGGGAQAVVIDGECLPSDAIAGVLVRTPAIEPAELPTIAAGDREYCAAEMTAFLTWWLTELPCPVVNRPTAVSLAGPGWSDAAWHVAAGELGLGRVATRWRAAPADGLTATAAVDRAGGPVAVGDVDVVTVVGKSCAGPGDPARQGPALALARAAGVSALAVTFRAGAGPPVFLQARPWVDIDDPVIADALLAHLLDPTGRSP